MKVSTKGQVTIPQEYREKLRLFPDSEIEFELRDGYLIIRKLKKQNKRGKDLLKRMRNKAEIKMSTEEILKHTRVG